MENQDICTLSSLMSLNIVLLILEHGGNLMLLMTLLDRLLGSPTNWVKRIDKFCKLLLYLFLKSQLEIPRVMNIYLYDLKV